MEELTNNVKKIPKKKNAKQITRSKYQNEKTGKTEAASTFQRETSTSILEIKVKFEFVFPIWLDNVKSVFITVPRRRKFKWDTLN